jgi:hypothetical protein
MSYVASNVVPPASSNLTELYLSDTFYTWHNKTNDLIAKVNPINVYSITADTSDTARGVVLSDDNNGNWTVGYVLGATIPGGHTFMGDIYFNAGVSGDIVNFYNGLTGSVIGVSSISGTGPIGNSGNVPGVPFYINGVTATTGGTMALDGSDIPNTIGSLTGPIGYMLTAVSGDGGSGPFTEQVKIFTHAASGGQTVFNIDPVQGSVYVNTTTLGDVDSNSSMTVHGNLHPNAIYIDRPVASGADIRMEDTGAIVADDSIVFNSKESGSFIFKAGGEGQNDGTAKLTINSSGNLIANDGDLKMGRGSAQFGIGTNGEILLGGDEAGNDGQFVTSQGDNKEPYYSAPPLVHRGSKYSSSGFVSANIDNMAPPQTLDAGNHAFTVSQAFQGMEAGQPFSCTIFGTIQNLNVGTGYIQVDISIGGDGFTEITNNAYVRHNGEEEVPWSVTVNGSLPNNWNYDNNGAFVRITSSSSSDPSMLIRCMGVSVH